MLKGQILLVVLPVLLFAGIALAQGGPGMGRLSRANPVTPEQKAYVQEATQLRDQVWQKQRELWALDSQEKPDEAAIKAKLAEVNALREKLHLLNVKNRALVQELAGQTPATGAGTGTGAGVGCPWGGPGPGAGRGMAPGAGRGMGAGRGRGMGAGAGRGMGRGGGGRGAGCPWGGPGRGACWQ